MIYRIIYTNNTVIDAVEQVENTYTSTNEGVFIGTVKDAISFLRKENINYQFLIVTFDLVEKELFNIPLSDLVIDSVTHSRVLSVIDFPIDFSNEIANVTFKITHDNNGIKKAVTYTFAITNDKIVEGVGEFDYFYNSIMVLNYPLSAVITGKVLEMDSRQVFDPLYNV